MFLPPLASLPSVWQHSSLSVRWIEVKGPGDSLRPTQCVWIDVLQSAGVAVEVCRVDEEGTAEARREKEAEKQRKRKEKAEEKARAQRKGRKKAKVEDYEDEEMEEDDEGGDEDEREPPSSSSCVACYSLLTHSRSSFQLTSARVDCFLRGGPTGTTRTRATATRQMGGRPASPPPPAARSRGGRCTTLTTSDLIRLATTLP